MTASSQSGALNNRNNRYKSYRIVWSFDNCLITDLATSAKPVSRTFFRIGKTFNFSTRCLFLSWWMIYKDIVNNPIFNLAPRSGGFEQGDNDLPRVLEDEEPSSQWSSPETWEARLQKWVYRYEWDLLIHDLLFFFISKSMREIGIGRHVTEEMMNR